MKKILFSALVGAMIISCSRDNDNSNPTTPQAPAISQTGILPTKLTYSKTGKADNVTTFSYNRNKLIKATYDNKDEIYTYTGDLITSINNPDGSSHIFNYDSNGNLISEKGESYNGSIKFNENNITYTVNGSTVTAQKISKNYDDITGTLSSITTSTITYTLDAKKRPTKMVEQKDTFDGSNNKTSEYTSTETFVYTSHQNLLKDIKGMDKLYHSHFMLTDMDELYDKNISEYKEESTEVTILGGNRHTSNVKSEIKYTYITNANNYPVKQQESHKDPSKGGIFVDDEGYTTIKY